MLPPPPGALACARDGRHTLCRRHHRLEAHASGWRFTMTGDGTLTVRVRQDVAVRHIDLSHVVRSGMVTYPGLPTPDVGVHLAFDESHGTYAAGTEFQIGRISMVGNTGTYLDTPAHRYRDGHDLAALPLEHCAGLPAVVVRAAGHGHALDAAVFADVDTDGRAVLVHTGWDTHWGTERYLDTAHPHLTEDACRALVDAGAVLVGIDSVNIDDTAVPVAVEGLATFPVRAFATID